MHTLNLEIFINEYIKIPQTESSIINDIKIFVFLTALGTIETNTCFVMYNITDEFQYLGP